MEFPDLGTFVNQFTHIFTIVLLLCTGSGDEDLGSSEESGKDWDELEEEAKKGCVGFICQV